MINPNDYSMISRSFIDTINKYLESGIRPGSFTECVLKNDLIGSFSRADYHNRSSMLDIVRMMVESMPIDSFGSHDIVEQWIARKQSGGKNGKEKAEHF